MDRSGGTTLRLSNIRHRLNRAPEPPVGHLRRAIAFVDRESCGISNGKLAIAHQCVRSNRHDFLGMSLGENPASHELAACRQEKGALGKPTIDCECVSDDPDTMTVSSQRRCELGTSCLLQSSRDIFKML